MFGYLIVGAPRQGKSNYTKAMITQPPQPGKPGSGTVNKPCYVADPQNEYGATYNTLINGQVVAVPGVGLPANQPQLLRSRYTGDHNGMDMDLFYHICSQKRGCNIIMDECTGILKGQLPKKLNSMLTGRFHTQNNWAMIFHSLTTIPPDLIRNTSVNYIVLFNTLDNAKDVHSKFGNHYLNEGLRLQCMKPDKAPPTIIDITGGRIDGKPFDRQQLRNTLF